MTQVRRLSAVGGLLTLAAILTSPLIWGHSGKDKVPDSGSRPARPDRPEPVFIDPTTAPTKFTDKPVVAYVNKDNETVVGFQVKAKAESRERPRDIAVIVDTTASQAGGPMNTAVEATQELIKQMGERDRLAIWTANLDAHNLSKDFLAKDKLAPAVKALKEEYPSGAGNLKKVLSQVVASFANERGRQRVVLLFGGSMSVAGPLTDDDRYELTEAMVKKEIAYFPVPLGLRLDPMNIHTLASGTGGSPLRFRPSEKTDEAVKRMLGVVALPIFYPTGYKAGADVVEAYPCKLPPLRTDVPTLMVAKIKPNGKLALAVEGTVADKDAKFEWSEPVPEAGLENYFLAGMFLQWKESKDRPAKLQADRALV